MATKQTITTTGNSDYKVADDDAESRVNKNESFSGSSRISSSGGSCSVDQVAEIEMTEDEEDFKQDWDDDEEEELTFNTHQFELHYNNGDTHNYNYNNNSNDDNVAAGEVRSDNNGQLSNVAHLAGHEMMTTMRVDKSEEGEEEILSELATKPDIPKNQLRSLAKSYVETSLDDLSYSSSSSGGEEDGENCFNEAKTLNDMTEKSLKSSTNTNETNQDILNTITTITNDDVDGKLINTGSRQSADEEVERRLLIQLQNQQRQQQQQEQEQLKKLAEEQQQQQEEFLKRKQPVVVDKERRRSSQQQQQVCYHENEQQQQEDEDEPPEVPVRRSSQSAAAAAAASLPRQSASQIGQPLPRGSQPRLAQYSMIRPPAIPRQQQQQRQHQQVPQPNLQTISISGFDTSQLPRPLLSEHELTRRRPTRRAPPPPPPPPMQQSAHHTTTMLHQQHQSAMGPRPTQPPPQPPVALRSAAMEVAAGIVGPPAPPTRSRSQPPRNIWSPSSSSLASSAGNCSSSCEDSLNLLATRMAPPTQTATSTTSSPSATSHLGNNNNNNNNNKITTDELPSSPSPQSTVVERKRRHLSGSELVAPDDYDDNGDGMASAKKVGEFPLDNGSSKASMEREISQQQQQQQLLKTNTGEQQEANATTLVSLQNQQTIEGSQLNIADTNDVERRPSVAADSLAQGDSGAGLVDEAQVDNDKVVSLAPPNCDNIVDSTSANNEPPRAPKLASSNNNNTNWRSFSVSLQPDAAEASSEGRSSSSLISKQIGRNSNQRSYSIATTSLASKSFRQQASKRLPQDYYDDDDVVNDGELKVHELQPPTKYWTLPSGLASQQQQQQTEIEAQEAGSSRERKRHSQEGTGIYGSGKAMRQARAMADLDGCVTVAVATALGDTSLRGQQQQQQQQQLGPELQSQLQSQPQQRPGDCISGSGRGSRQHSVAAAVANSATNGNSSNNNKTIEHQAQGWMGVSQPSRRPINSLACERLPANVVSVGVGGGGGGKRPSADHLDNKPMGQTGRMARHHRHLAQDSAAAAADGDDYEQQQEDEELEIEIERPYCVTNDGHYEARNQQQQYQSSKSNYSTSDQQQQQQQQQKVNNNISNNNNGGLKDEWLKQMYKQMHKQITPEKSLLQAVNSQPDTTQIKIKLKSPKNDHRFSPSYYSEEDFERRRDKNSVSPTFKPGSICNYLPGHSSISLHERNLELYHRLIDHIDRVFSSVLPEVTSRSTNTLQATKYKCQHKYQQQIRQQSRSGPQSPVSTLEKRRSHRFESLHGNEDDLPEFHAQDHEHNRKCVFTQMLRDETNLRGPQTGLPESHCPSGVHESGIEDPRKQYVAVQQGHDIPLKGLRKPAPQPNVYKVGPAPPIIEPLLQASKQNGHMSNNNKTIQSHYLNHLQKLNNTRSPSRFAAAAAAASGAGNSSSRSTRASSLGRETPRLSDNWLDEIYQDFNNVYQSMSCADQNPEMANGNLLPEVVVSIDADAITQKSNRQQWASRAAYETEKLAKSMVDVEEALRRATMTSGGTGDSESPLPAMGVFHANLGNSPGADSSSTYGQIIGQHINMEPSPMLSLIGGDQTRPESSNTNQSYQMNGPALVEEMTLSDLEDEISSSLLATKESASRQRQRQRAYLSEHNAEQLIRGRRNRNPLPASLHHMTRASQLGGGAGTSGYHSDHSSQPLNHQHHRQQQSADQMFSDESINIHYRAPTSKLLKMNTFNEFELNRIKKFYNDELASRLQRSKSSRLTSGPAGDWSTSHSSHRAQQTRSASELLKIPNAGRPFQRTEASLPPLGGRESPFVDLNRYQRALFSKQQGATTTSAAGAGGMGAGSSSSRLARARFGRALFDFHAKNEGELSVCRGDLVELVEILDHSWARVEDCQSGLQGLVPLNYIDYSVGCAVAKRDIQNGQQRYVNPSETVTLLPMSKGEPITLIRRLSGHWYEASNTRQTMGLVWSNDLDIIKQPVLAATINCNKGNNLVKSGARRSFTRSKTPTGCSGGGGRYSCAAPSGFCADDDFSDDYDDDNDEEDEEEMYILDNGERVLARRRARSASGLPERKYNQTAHQNRGQNCQDGNQYQHSHKCCQQPHPVQLTGQISSGNQLVGGNYNNQPPRRSSSSPYISGLSGVGNQQYNQANATAIAMEAARQTTQILKQNAPQQVNISGVFGGQLPRLCRAKYAYEARQKDELDLQVGDILMVVHECDDGWFIGTSYSSKQAGTFPGNFVEPIK